MKMQQWDCSLVENRLLTLAGNVQGMFDRPGLTHRFMNRQAILILAADGYKKESGWLKQNLSAFNNGAVWADADWKNAHHYLNPVTRRGLWRFRSAAEDFEVYFQRALTAGKRADDQEAAFFLGAAAHLLQDLCVPHHARGKLFDGHKAYEIWAARCRNDFKAANAGLYYDSSAFLRCLYNNAVQAADWYEYVDISAGEQDYRRATEILLPWAQRSTAGLVERFWTLSNCQMNILGWQECGKTAN